MSLSMRQLEMKRRMKGLPKELKPRARKRRWVATDDEWAIKLAESRLINIDPGIERVDISVRLLTDLIALAKIGASTRAAAIEAQRIGASE